MTMRTDPSAIRKQIQSRLASLRTRSYAELATLPAHATDEVAFGPRVFTVTTYRDQESGAVRLVVQALPRDAGLVWTEAQADGFRRWATGAIEPVPERELFEFT